MFGVSSAGNAVGSSPVRLATSAGNGNGWSWGGRRARGDIYVDYAILLDENRGRGVILEWLTSCDPVLAVSCEVFVFIWAGCNMNAVMIKSDSVRHIARIGV